MAAMTADPAQRLSSIDLLDAAEHDTARCVGVTGRRWLAADRAGVDSGVVRRAGRPRRRRGRDHLRRTVVDVSRSVEAANRLAHLLVGQGAGPGQRVAVVIPRSAEAIVAILAVLKTGAAYVPIDPSVPAARLEFVLGDAAPIAAVTTAGVRPQLDGFAGQIVDIDDAAVARPTRDRPAGAGGGQHRLHHLHLGHRPAFPRASRSRTAT